MRGNTELFCLKAVSGLPLENFINITWGLGRTRTIATPLDRHNATVSFGDLADLNRSYAYRGLGRVQPW